MVRKAFSNLQYSHVCSLLDLLDKIKLNKLSNIQRLFDENSQGFDEVVSFLTEINILVLGDSTLSLNLDFANKDKDFRRAEIIQRVLGIKNKYRNEIFGYIGQFSFNQGKISYRPPDQKRSSESDVRNFLIDIGMVRLVQVRGIEEYVLLPEYVSLYVSARNNTNFTSPELLENKIEAQNELGFAAEEKIVEHERDRVGQIHAHKVDHISKRNCAAGYDILSLTIEKDSTIVPRFIEVKAVPTKSFQFFWSKNEVEIARKLKDWYFLYLLPVGNEGKFEINNLMMISNPCDNLLKSNSNWVIESDVLICHLKSVGDY
ncbi:MAG: DUF3883 domain-containing protein [Paracoccaceae bacterium]|nr:DUF3883 domain-containing protein [Paracoccaceae bacterium]MDE2673714.1 DUF3883 domain-containing protein [Paracoccaceae bacterium]